MKRLSTCFGFLFCFVSAVATAQSKQKKVVFIIADGIPADVIEKVATPNIDAIARQGKYMRAYVPNLSSK